MMKRLAAFLVAGTALFFVACSDKIEPGEKAPQPVVLRGIPIKTAEETERPLLYEAVGTVAAGIRTQIGAKLMGTVEEIRVREGDRVRQGDVLVVLDARQVRAELGRADAGVMEAKKGLSAALSAREAARASERLAHTTYQRFLNLKKESSVSKQEFDEVEARYRQAAAALKEAEAMVEAASARVSQAEAQVKTARVSTDDALVRAPHAGVITAKFVDKGDLARPGAPLLSLETTAGFCVDVVVPETYVRHLQPDGKVKVTIPALGPAPLEGKVCTLVPKADPTTRSFIFKVTLPDRERVTSGLFARVEIPVGSTRQILVPAAAILRQGQLTGVYRVDENQTLHFRLVRLGKRVGDTYEVLSGLKPGDRYVAGEVPGLRDGAKVEAAS